MEFAPGHHVGGPANRVSIEAIEMQVKIVVLPVLLFLLFLLGCQSSSEPVKRQSIPEPDIRTENIRRHLATLADDAMEGRLPGTSGGEKAAQYVADQYQQIGLETINDGSYFQAVPLVGVSPERVMTLEVSHGEETAQYAFGDEFVAWPGVEEETVSLERAPLIFVGYGIRAPETDWDDYKDRDVSGKVVVLLVNDPPSDDPAFFGGQALTYYGRWTYKLEEAARQGAVGVILIHNTEMAGYPWNVVESSWTGEQFRLPRQEEKSTRVEAWVTEEVGEELLNLAGLTFEEAVEAASDADFEPVELNGTVSIQINSTTRGIESPNVIGRLTGNDPELQEQVLLITTHYDHLGTADASHEGDRIYNGAFDNASGTALLIEVARALEEHRESLGRSVLFAAVTAEEQGLLGSEYYATQPLVPLSQTAANINIDGINVWGETDDIVAMGAERSSIQEIVEQVTAEMGLEISPDPFPEKGYFFRSDQFSLVKQGIPAVYYDFGLQFRGRPEGWGQDKMNNYTEQHYHQPSDEYDPDWSLEGAIQMGQLVYRTVYYLANQSEMPQWRPGDPFERIREESLAEGR